MGLQDLWLIKIKRSAWQYLIGFMSFKAKNNVNTFQLTVFTSKRSVSYYRQEWVSEVLHENKTELVTNTYLTGCLLGKI